jgi:ABC-2 type transport system ATP-binding protein
MLSVEGLVRRYGDCTVLPGLTLEARAGEVLGLLGPNGAGKSTLLRTLAGLQPPDAGSVRIAGVDLVGDPLEARRRLGYAAEEPAFYDELSSAEHLAFVAAVRGLEPAVARERADGLLRSLALEERRDQPVADLSHGMRKKLSFAAATLHRPVVLLLDEALEGFDVASALAAKRAIREAAAAGAAVVFASHVVETLERLCDRITILHRGTIVRDLPRAAWGDPHVGPSPLEREFLTVIGCPPVPEGSE